MVRLTTATALQQCVDVSSEAGDNFHAAIIIRKLQANLFDLSVFIPFLAPTVAELLGLIDEVETVETKNKLAACLSTIIDRSRAEVLF